MTVTKFTSMGLVKRKQLILSIAVEDGGEVFLILRCTTVLRGEKVESQPSPIDIGRK